MIVYKNYSTFIIKGQEIDLISDEISNSQNTVAEINGTYYYLGNETPNVLAAVLAWQESTGQDLNTEELQQVMIDNQLVSDAI